MLLSVDMISGWGSLVGIGIPVSTSEEKNVLDRQKLMHIYYVAF